MGNISSSVEDEEDEENVDDDISSTGSFVTLKLSITNGPCNIIMIKY